MRINPDTKDALLFMTGLLGMVAQGVLAAFGVSPSVPLIAAYLAMCGIAAGSSMLGNGWRDDNGADSDGDGAPQRGPKSRGLRGRDRVEESDDA